MKYLWKFWIAILVSLTGVLSTGLLQAQVMPVPQPKGFYPLLHAAANSIVNPKALDAFYQKLFVLKNSDTGLVNIVHIGDSHLQAGFFTGVIRKGLQSYFGNAGRGLIFPYQLAASNTQPDISAWSNTRWKFNRVAHPELPGAPGISGFVISSSAAAPVINIALKPELEEDLAFNKIKLFASKGTSWILHPSNDSTPYMLKAEESDSLPYQESMLQSPALGFSMAPLADATSVKSFYGVSLENGNSGVLYHTIGVNGARYESYNNASLFTQQLGALKADLYILSLGTNEAQSTSITRDQVSSQMESLIDKLLSISPEAAILITTPADSYLRGRTLSNPMNLIHGAQTAFATALDFALWDLYEITGGYYSARRWRASRLLARDNIHYTKEAYEYQGSLLLEALANGYNQYVRSKDPAGQLR